MPASLKLLPARRRSAAGHREARRAASATASRARCCSGVTGTGKTFTAGQRHRPARQADAGPVAQQDARRPALQGVQGVLPAQRRPLLRQLLRLLPARSLHPAARHLHREGRLDQREHRPPAPGRHQRPGQPRGRDHRRQRLVHLRPGLARATTSAMMVRLAEGETVDRDELLLQAGRHPVRAQRHRLRARQVPRPRRRASRSGRPTRSSPSASSCSATRSSALAIINPTQRRDARSRRTSCTSTRPSTSSRRRSASRRPSRASSRSWTSGWSSSREQGKLLEAQRLQRPHALRHGDAAGGRPLPRHRELQPRWFSGRKPGEPPYTLHRLLPRRLPADRRRVARHAAAGPRHVRRRPQPQDARWSSTASACPAPWTTGRCGSTSGRSSVKQVLFMSATPGPYELEQSGGEVVEQVIRPTGLVDPVLARQAGPRPGAAT